MKLRSLIPVAAIAFLVSCGPSTYQLADGTEIVVPRHTRTAFVEQYPTAAEIAWSHYDPNMLTLIEREWPEWADLTEDDYVVTFTVDETPYYAYYDADGNWLGTVYVVTDMNTVPVAVTTVVSDKYPGYSISTVRKESWKNMTAYELELKNGDTKMKVLVDQNGNIIKTKTKSM
jgi:hypothetical protein